MLLRQSLLEAILFDGLVCFFLMVGCCLVSIYVQLRWIGSWIVYGEQARVFSLDLDGQ